MPENLETVDFLTFPEVVSLLRVTRPTAAKLLKDGSLPAYKVGRSVRIPKKDFLAWLERNRYPTK